jgi:P-type Ca2+ transporter type 2C
MNPPGNGSQSQPSRSPSARRPRAPTITIDTSAVSGAPGEGETHQLNPLSSPFDSESPKKAKQEQESRSIPPPPSSDSSRELRGTASFESRESRPTSPHNVSSPVTRWNGQPHNFLSVPMARSRGNSVDSEEIAHSPTSYGGDTYLPSSSSSNAGFARHTETAHSNDLLLPDNEALKPDPGTEDHFNVEDNRFAFSPGQLNKLLNPKSLGAFHALGGLVGLEKGLRTDRLSGLSVDETFLEGKVSFEEATTTKASTDHDSPESHTQPKRHDTGMGAHLGKDTFRDRKRIFSDNRLPQRKPKGFLELAWMAYNDKMLLLLTAAAIISTALGIYQSVRTTQELAQPGDHSNVDEGEKVAWVEGVAIFVAIVVVVLVGALNDWQKEKQFVKLNARKEDRQVKVIRSGKSLEISVNDILVGDVVHLEAGDKIPVDGIFISGHNVTCDESSATGESDLLKKTAGDVVYKAIEEHESLHKLDPFIISGGTVTEGVGTYLATATGMNSSHGRIMLSLQEDPQTTPLQSKLNVLAEYIAKLGLAAGGILFLATFIRFLVRLNVIPTPDQKGQAFLQVFITAVTIIVVAVPEGLPLAVTLALAFATKRMLKDNNLVRHMRACETMGNATTICSDKTGTLTQNVMSVVSGTIGTKAQFGDGNISPNESAESPSTKEIDMGNHSADQQHPAQIMNLLCDEVKELLKQSIIMNSTAFEGESEGKQTFIGSKTETALLLYARDHLSMLSLSEERIETNIVQLVPFDSKRKCMATVVRLPNGSYRMFVKGASEIMLNHCSKVIQDPLRDTVAGQLTPEDIEFLNNTINSYANRSLRTIGLLYRDFEEWPPRGAPVQRDDPKLVEFESVFQDMTLISIVGIKDPLRPGVSDAVRTCQKAGVFVRMVTGDNIITAKAIASDCGIYTPGGIVMEGPQFRKMNKTQMNRVLPRLQVLARSSPEDKKLLVKRLKELGETVAVTGDGTNDAAALKVADVGFSMGIAGTEVAKEASDIILMDDNFASIVKALLWGRAVNDAVKKFLQVSFEYPSEICNWSNSQSFKSLSTLLPFFLHSFLLWQAMKENRFFPLYNFFG